MFSLVPSLLLILSIAVVIIITLRHLPHVVVREDTVTNLRDNVQLKSPAGMLAFVKSVLVGLWNWLSGHAHAAKDYRVKTNYLEKMSSVILRAARLKDQPQEKPPFITSEQNPEKETKSTGASPEEQAYIKAIANDPNDRNAYEGLGRAYTDRENFKDALEVYEYLTGSYPETDSYWSRLGLVRFKLFQFEKAADAYERAIEINPAKPTRLVNLGLCYEAMGELTRATNSLEKALVLLPDNPQYMLVLADLLIKENKKDRASNLIEKVLQMDPTNHTARQKLMELKF